MACLRDQQQTDDEPRGGIVVDGLHVPEHALSAKRGGIRWGEPIGKITATRTTDRGVEFDVELDSGIRAVEFTEEIYPDWEQPLDAGEVICNCYEEVRTDLLGSCYEERERLDTLDHLIESAEKKWVDNSVAYAGVDGQHGIYGRPPGATGASFCDIIGCFGQRNDCKLKTDLLGS